MFGLNDVSEPELVPVYELVVGDPPVFHTIPWDVTVAPPLLVTVYPDDAELVVIELTAVVVTVGAETLRVVKLTCGP